MLQIVGQRLELEAFGNAVLAPWLSDRLEPSDQQLAGIFLEVGAGIGIAQHRKVFWQSGNRFGDDVEMLGRMQRHCRSGGSAQFLGPHARAVYDKLAANFTTGGPNSLCDAILDNDLRNLLVLEDPRPTGLGGFCQGLRGIDRIGLTVARKMNGTYEIGGIQQRPQRTCLLGGEHIDVEAKTPGHRRASLQFFKALAVRRERERTNLAKAGSLARDLFERGVEFGRVLRKTRQIMGGP